LESVLEDLIAAPVVTLGMVGVVEAVLVQFELLVVEFEQPKVFDVFLGEAAKAARDNRNIEGTEAEKLDLEAVLGWQQD
jgi:hypothetical protein